MIVRCMRVFAVPNVVDRGGVLLLEANAFARLSAALLPAMSKHVGGAFPVVWCHLGCLLLCLGGAVPSGCTSKRSLLVHGC